MKTPFLLALGVMAALLTSCSGGESAGQSNGQSNGQSLVSSDIACSEQGGFFKAVFALTNAERQKIGASPLTLSAELIKAAQSHSEDMARQNYFSHTGLNSSTPANRAIAAGYGSTSVGENIGAGYKNPLEVVQGWLNSPGHKENILRTSYTEIGIGFATSATSQYEQYWTQVFGDRTSKSAAPASALPDDFFKSCTVSQPTQAISSVKGWAPNQSFTNLSTARSTAAIVSTPEPKQLPGLLCAGLGLLFFNCRRK